MKIRNQLLGLALLLFSVCTFFAYFILHFFMEELKPSIQNFPQIVQNNIISHNLETQILKLNLYHSKSSYYYKDFFTNKNLQSKQKFFLYSTLLKEELSLMQSNNEFEDLTTLRKVSAAIEQQEQKKFRSLVQQKIDSSTLPKEAYINTMLDQIMEQFHKSKSRTHVAIRTFAKKTEESSQRFEVLFLLLLILSATFVITTSIFISNNLTQQLKKLLSFITAIKNGKFETQIDQLNTVELSELANEFHLMGNSLQESTVSKSLLETEIIQRKKIQADAEKATIAKSEFLSTMSHELRTPLNSVIVLSSLLKESKLNATQQSYTNLINSSGQSLLALINDILDFSKIEEGKFQLNIESFNLEETIQEVSEIYYPLMLEKGLEFRQDIDPEIPLYLLGDDIRIKQILINFIGNALKFTHKGFIKVSVSQTSNTTTSSSIKFEVEDSGIGISQDKVNLIFDRFTQENTSTTRNYGGSGLGLSICQQLAQLMDGEIGVESQEKQGSKFYVTFDFQIDPAKSRVNHNLTKEDISIVLQSESSSNTIASNLSSKGLNCVISDSVSSKNKVIICDLIRLQEFFDHPSNQENSFKDIQLITILFNIKQIETFESLKKSYPSIEYIMFPFEFNNLLVALSTEEKLPVLENKSIDPQFMIEALVVDDNRTNCFVAKEILLRLGVKVDIAKNGLEALQAVQKKDYQIVFMDCQMPVMNGFEASISIRNLNHEKYKGLPIIALSADIQASTQEQCIQSGMNGYLSKPISKSKLIDELSKISKSFKKDEVPTPKATLQNLPSFIDEERILDIVDHNFTLESFEFLQMIFESFVDNSEQYIHNIKLHSASLNFTELRKELHTLRGIAANLGLVKVLASVCSIDVTEEPSDIDPKVKSLSRAVTEVNEWYDEFFDPSNPHNFIDS